MAKEIAARWKALDPQEKERVEKLAKKDMLRYRDEVKSYEEEMVQKNRAEREEAAAKELEERAAEQERAKKLNAERAEKEAELRRNASLHGVGAGAAASLEALGALAGARLPVGPGAEDPAVQEALLFYQQREMIQRQLLLEELRVAEERELQLRRLQNLGLLQADPSLAGLQGHQLGGLLGGHGAAGIGGLGGYGGLGLLGGGGGLSSHEMLLGAGGAGLQDAYHQIQQQNLLQEHYARLLGGHGGADNPAGAPAST